MQTIADGALAENIDTARHGNVPDALVDEFAGAAGLYRTGM